MCIRIARHSLLLFLYLWYRNTHIHHVTTRINAHTNTGSWCFHAWYPPDFKIWRLATTRDFFRMDDSRFLWMWPQAGPWTCRLEDDLAFEGAEKGRKGHLIQNYGWQRTWNLRTKPSLLVSIPHPDWCFERESWSQISLWIRSDFESYRKLSFTTWQQCRWCNDRCLFLTSSCLQPVW